MNNQKVKMLVDSKVCISLSQARKMVLQLPEEKLNEYLKWGRKPHKKKMKIVWPEKENKNAS